MKTTFTSSLCISVFTFFLLFTFNTSAQVVPPCLPSSGGEPAGDSPPGCNLCGPIYAGSTGGYNPGPPGDNGFPCGTIENNQFLQIVAGPVGVLEATILAANCRDSAGVELIIYDQSFTPVSNCFSSGGVNLPGNVVASGLTPGQIYWIMIDGYEGDSCEILLTVTGGADAGPPDPPGPITVDPFCPEYCPGVTVCYSINDVRGATGYEWIVPGNAIIVSGGNPKDTEVCVEYTAPGGGVVRVTPYNPCFSGFPSIEPVVVVPLIVPPNPPIFFCQNDFPIIVGNDTITSPGDNEFCYITSKGCDSCVTYVLIPRVQIPGFVEASVCIGDCFMIGDTCVTSSGTYEVPSGQQNGCDSLVTLSLTELDSLSAPQIDCEVQSNQIIFSWTDDFNKDGYLIEIQGVIVDSTQDQSYSFSPMMGDSSISFRVIPYGSASCPYGIGEAISGQSEAAGPIATLPANLICPGEEICFSIAPVSGASNYNWEIPPNGRIVSGGGLSDTLVCVRFDSSGTSEIKVTPSTDCFMGAPSNTSVVINPVKDSIVPPQFICLHDFPVTIDGNTFNTPGTYTFNFQSLSNGCDSTVSYVLLPSLSIPKTFNMDLCVGDCFMFGDSCYFDSTRIEILNGQTNGCDSIVILNLNPIDSVEAPNITCSIFADWVSIEWDEVLNSDGYLIEIQGAIVDTIENQLFYEFQFSPNDTLFEIRLIPFGNVSCPFGISEVTCNVNTVSTATTFHESGIKIHPNPTDGFVQIESKCVIENVTVFDFSGKIVLETMDQRISLFELPAGIYFFRIKSNEETVVRKVFKN